MNRPWFRRAYVVLVAGWTALLLVVGGTAWAASPVIGPAGSSIARRQRPALPLVAKNWGGSIVGWGDTVLHPPERLRKASGIAAGFNHSATIKDGSVFLLGYMVGGTEAEADPLKKRRAESVEQGAKKV